MPKTTHTCFLEQDKRTGVERGWSLTQRCTFPLGDTKPEKISWSVHWPNLYYRRIHIRRRFNRLRRIPHLGKIQTCIRSLFQLRVRLNCCEEKVAWNEWRAQGIVGSSTQSSLSLKHVTRDWVRLLR